MSDHQPRIGLVLGAGGIVGGAFHAGVLAALEHHLGWDPRRADIIVGTSAGSVAGATLRAGVTAADIFARAEDRPMSAAGDRLLAGVGPQRRPPPLRPVRARRPAEIATVLARAAARPWAAPPWAILGALIPEGSVSTAAISDSIAAVFGERWPDDPLWLCAVRQGDGQRVTFGRDGRMAPLPDVVAASCAIPGYFSPVDIGGEAYVDGGVHSPTNADVLAREPLDLVIVSSPMSISGRRPRLGARSVARRWASTLLDAEALRLRRRGIPLVAFQPTDEDAEVMGINAMDPTRRAAVARCIFESTARRLAHAGTLDRLAPLRRAS